MFLCNLHTDLPVAMLDPSACCLCVCFLPRGVAGRLLRVRPWNGEQPRLSVEFVLSDGVSDGCGILALEVEDLVE